MALGCSEPDSVAGLTPPVSVGLFQRCCTLGLGRVTAAQVDKSVWELFVEPRWLISDVQLVGWLDKEAHLQGADMAW